MFERDSLRGIIPPLATPLTRAGGVDRQGMGRLVEHVLSAGVHGVFVLGSTGEFPFLTGRQRRQVVEAAGADFVIVTAPYFGTMSISQEWISRHVLAIVEATGARVMLYNVPPLITDMDPPTIARLAEHDHVVGMKDSAQLSHVQDVVFRTRGRDFRVLCGTEYHLVAALLVGAHGGTPSPANLIPRDYVELYAATAAGRIDDALAMQERVNRFSDRLDEIPSWSSVVKASLHLMGICGPTVAAPLPSLTAEHLEIVEAHLRKYGLLS